MLCGNQTSKHSDKLVKPVIKETQSNTRGTEKRKTRSPYLRLAWLGKILEGTQVLKNGQIKEGREQSQWKTAHQMCVACFSYRGRLKAEWQGLGKGCSRWLFFLSHSGFMGKHYFKQDTVFCNTLKKRRRQA